MSLPGARSRGPDVGAAEGWFGKWWQASSARAPRSWKFASRETRRLLLMRHNSPGSLPFSHNKHTAKSLASRFDEATCISPFSVYRKLLLKKVILVFTARVKGPGRLPLCPPGSGRGRVRPCPPGGTETLLGAHGHQHPLEPFLPEISSVSPWEKHFLLSEVRCWCKLLPLQGLAFAWSSVFRKAGTPFHPARS